MTDAWGAVGTQAALSRRPRGEGFMEEVVFAPSLEEHVAVTSWSACIRGRPVP